MVNYRPDAFYRTYCDGEAASTRRGSGFTVDAGQKFSLSSLNVSQIRRRLWRRDPRQLWPPLLQRVTLCGATREAFPPFPHNSTVVIYDAAAAAAALVRAAAALRALARRRSHEGRRPRDGRTGLIGSVCCSGLAASVGTLQRFQPVHGTSARHRCAFTLIYRLRGTVGEAADAQKPRPHPAYEAVNKGAQ